MTFDQEMHKMQCDPMLATMDVAPPPGNPPVTGPVSRRGAGE
jgi:hypothetical protein